MLGWLESRKSLCAENGLLRRELHELRHALDRSLAREGDALAMLDARDRDVGKLRTDLERMTNAALSRSMRAPQEQPRDERGRFARAA